MKTDERPGCQPDAVNDNETLFCQKIWREDSSELVPTNPQIRMVRLCFCAALFYGLLSIAQSTDPAISSPPPMESTIQTDLIASNRLLKSAPLLRNKESSSSSLMVPLEPIKESPQKAKKNKNSICFVTSIAEDDVTEGPLKHPTVDSIQSISSYRRQARKHNFQFFLVSDILPEPRPKGWTMLEQPLLQDTSLETVERFVQYMPQEHAKLSEECGVVFFMSYLESVVPRADPNVFVELAKRIQESEHGLALYQNENQTLQTLATSLMEQDPSNKVDMERSMELFDLEGALGAPVFNTTFFGLDLNNALLSKARKEFWNLYRSESLTVYDSLLFSYIIHKHKLRPLTDLAPIDELMNFESGRVTSGGNKAGRLATPQIQPKTPIVSPRQLVSRKVAARRNQQTQRRRRQRKRNAIKSP